MKIHLYGNVLNWAYQFGTYLRTLGHDVRVFIDAREASPLYQPAWEHGESRELPDWIATVDARIVSEGDGDWDQGCRHVEARWQRFVNGRAAAWKSSENGSNR